MPPGGWVQKSMGVWLWRNQEGNYSEAVVADMFENVKG